MNKVAPSPINDKEEHAILNVAGLYFEHISDVPSPM
jgi:hypothetical protein